MRKWASYTITDFYEYYHEQYPLGLDYKRFKALLVDYYTILSNELLSGVCEFKMPYKLGVLSIVKYRPKTHTSKSLSVDFKATKQFGKTIFHLNDHSNGYKYRLFWHKNMNRNFGIYRYGATLVRANKRKLANIIHNKLNDFPEI